MSIDPGDSAVATPDSASDPAPRLTPEDTQRIIALAMDFAREGRTEDLMEFIDHGLPVDTLDHEANTPLMLAAYHGHQETVTALLARGADVDARNTRDQSIVAGAMFKGEDAIVRQLIEAGADLDVGTPTARQAAVLFGREHLLAD
ncbi:MAG: ankyrin repeat domain-containing protein [Propionibacteriaceae bacterium]|nr:ankyrin repeat domain-containing protein [Propionibacteriaceae bacterium]